MCLRTEVEKLRALLVSLLCFLERDDMRAVTGIFSPETWNLIRDARSSLAKKGAGDNFWQRCVDAECVVVPVIAFSGYGKDGNYDPALSMGIRYAAQPVHSFPVAPDFFFMVDECSAGEDKLYSSPTSALEAYENRLKRLSERRAEQNGRQG